MKYSVHIPPWVWKEMKNLPGNIKQRLKKSIDVLSQNPHPPKSKKLNAPEFPLEIYRLRLDRWRVIYALNNEDKSIDILGVRKRPPYNYEDLGELLQNIL